MTTTKTVVCLSNLAIAPAFRRQGVALQLCRAAERVAKDDWGYEELYLKVERDNVSAIKLYQDKLGYAERSRLPADPAVRLDPVKGEFVETAVETLILSKTLS